MTVGGVEQDFGGNVVWTTTNGLLALSRVLYKSSQTEVPDLDIHIGVEEDVAELEVAVNNLMCVHIVARADELNREEVSLTKRRR